MTYMPRSALSASPAGGGTDLAAELSVNRRIRNAESFSESQALFTARTKRQVAVEADIARLRELAESLGVTGVDALEPSRIDETVADLAASGEPARVVEQAAAAAGHLDALVCNQAMSSPDGSLSEMTEAVLDAHWAVDARASILLAQAFAAQAGFAPPAPSGSPRRRGSIVFLTSGQGLGPLPGEIAYAAAKAAIAGLTLTISDELIDAGITVNTVNPGPVDTGYVTEADREATAVMFPQGRWGEPDDAARLITWLLTDEARWITGQVINSEGGFARWRR